MTSHLPSAHTYTIKEAARLTGLPESTLRYYESIGIIEPIQRDASSKHRVYSEENLNVLDAVACLNATGMSISDMRAYFDNRSRGDAAADEQIALLERQEKRLNDEASLLKIRQEYTKYKAAYWRAIKSKDDTLTQDMSVRVRALAGELKRLNGSKSTD